MNSDTPFSLRLQNSSKLRIALIGAMDEEVELLKQSLADREETRIAGFAFYTGTLNDVEIVLLQSGIGKVNAAVGTAILLHQFKPDCVINTGSAGGFDASLKIGDVVISSEVRHHDVDLTAFNYEPGQMAGMPPAFLPDDKLVSIAQQCIGKMADIQTVTGLIATGDAFMHDAERVARVRETFPAMQACEMEAAAIAQCCYRFDVPFLIIRALSDIAGQTSNISFDQFLEQAAKHSAEMVLSIVAGIAEAQTAK